MIGEADTKAPRPYQPARVAGYAKGALLELEVSCKATGLGFIADDFNNLDAWIPVYGQLYVSGGSTSDVYGPIIGYGAARHKTQLLSDNCRAKVVIQDGVIAWGESRVFICSDERMAGYYGMAISKDLLGPKVAIIRGRSSIAVDRYEETAVTLSAGDEFTVWYDRRNSTVRVYQNEAEICSKYFPPTDIPHGPGCRWTGVVMSARWLLDQGPRFDAFEATDLPAPEPVVHDPIDDLTPNAKWVPVLNDVTVNRHLAFPPSLGPDNVLFGEAAVRWEDEMDTTSVRVVFTVLRVVSGTFRLAVRSNSGLTNWVGVEFDALTNEVSAVKGTGPTTVTRYGTAAEWVSTAQQYTVTYDNATKTIRLYKGAKRAPIVEHAYGGTFTPTAKYVGLVWETDLLTAGVELLSIDGYNVTAEDPI